MAYYYKIIFTYLSNSVLALDDREDTSLLDGRGLVETITIDTTEYLFLQSHLVKIVNFKFPVRFEFFSILFYTHVTELDDDNQIETPTLGSILVVFLGFFSSQRELIVLVLGSCVAMVSSSRETRCLKHEIKLTFRPLLFLRACLG